MASKPKILTIIPAYNAARFLRETVNSILNQKGADINLIIIDDKSTDDTLKIAHSIKEATVFNNTENKGNYYSGNLILSKYLKDNSWDYYCFHGADDISHSNRFIKQLDLFDDNTLAVGCRFQRMDYKTRRIKPVNPKTNESQLIFSRKALDLIGFRDSGRAGCDTEYKRRLLIARPGSIKSVDEILMTAYTHDNNLTKKIPIGGEYRRRYVRQFTKKHENMKKSGNFYQDFKA